MLLWRQLALGVCLLSAASVHGTGWGQPHFHSACDWLRGQQAVASAFARCNERKQTQRRISWGKNSQVSEQAIKVNTLWVPFSGEAQHSKLREYYLGFGDHLEFLTHNEWMTSRLWKHFLALWFSIEETVAVFPKEPFDRTKSQFTFLQFYNLHV